MMTLSFKLGKQNDVVCVCVCVSICCYYSPNPCTFTHSTPQLVTARTLDLPLAHKPSYRVHAALVCLAGVCVRHTLVHICKAKSTALFCWAPKYNILIQCQEHKWGATNGEAEAGGEASRRDSCVKNIPLCFHKPRHTSGNLLHVLSSGTVANCQDLQLARFIKGNNSGLC